jgi:WD40 repeat protein
VPNNGVSEPGSAKLPEPPAQPVSIPWYAGKLLCMALAPDGQTVALGGQNETVELWNATTGKWKTSLKENPKQVSSLAFSPDGKTLAVGCFTQVQLWDMTKQPVQKVRTLKEHTGDVITVQFFPDDKTLASATASEAKVWAPDQETIIKGGKWLLFPDGKTLAKYSFFLGGNKLWLYDVAGKVERGPVELGLSDSLGTLVAACSANSQTLAIGQDRKVMWWDDVTRPVKSLPSHSRHTDYVISVDLSPDGTTLASGDVKGEVILWNINTKTEIAPLKKHTGRVLVRFSPRGKILATGSDKDPAVRLWNTTTGENKGELPGHADGVKDIQFSSNGQTLAVRCPDQVKLWNVESFTAPGK